MLVFWNQNLVFLSVPKTGTTAMEATMAPFADIVISHPPELKHAPLYRYNRFIQPMFERVCKREHMETMAVVREPISWLGSWFRYRQREGIRGHPNSTHDLSFDDFVQAYMQPKSPPFAKVGSQVRFLEPNKKGKKINHLFRYDKQEKLREFLENRLERKLNFQRRNVSPKLNLFLSQETEAKLRRKFYADFALYESIL
ncbi:sulfotransferase family 2 domain-containing protein [Pseudopelagicola sp. nBUS_20]|uniref:sulfotransferase family 2 domain-containing protein n=1 Tax=Pseudopelagicola sp. nBUS_20 TaxID=3395317 RepID=UPI003EC00926